MEVMNEFVSLNKKLDFVESKLGELNDIICVIESKVEQNTDRNAGWKDFSEDTPPISIGKHGSAYVLVRKNDGKVFVARLVRNSLTQVNSWNPAYSSKVIPVEDDDKWRFV